MFSHGMFARTRLLQCLASPVIVSCGALCANVLAGRSAEPYVAFVIGCAIVVIVSLAYLALVFDASEREAIYRFLGHALTVRSGSTEAASG